MDEMKLNLSSNFMRTIVSNIISKIILKNFDIKPNIHINSLKAELKNGKIQFHIDTDGEVDQSVFIKIDRIIDDK